MNKIAYQPCRQPSVEELLQSVEAGFNEQAIELALPPSTQSSKLYKFYDRYDKHKYKRLSSEEKILCKKIKNHSKIWECIIRWTFYVCFSLFILFLVTSGVLSRFKDMIGS